MAGPLQRLVGVATALVLACAPSVSAACAALCSSAGDHRAGLPGSDGGAHPAAHGNERADEASAGPATPVHHHVNEPVNGAGSGSLTSIGRVGVAADAPLCCAHLGSAPSRSATSRVIATVAHAPVAIAPDASLSLLATRRNGVHRLSTSTSPPILRPLVTLRI